MNAISKIADVALTSQVDQLGTLLAQIATLTKQADAIKAQFKGFGDEFRLEGNLFALSVSHTARETVDMKAFREEASPTVLELLDACTRSTPVSTVRVVSR